MHDKATLPELRDHYALDEALDAAEALNAHNYNQNQAHKVAEARAKARAAARNV